MQHKVNDKKTVTAPVARKAHDCARLLALTLSLVGLVCGSSTTSARLEGSFRNRIVSVVSRCDKAVGISLSAPRLTGFFMRKGSIKGSEYISQSDHYQPDQSNIQECHVGHPA